MSGAHRANGSGERELAELVDALGARLQAGEAVDVEAVARAHPQHAAELRELLPALANLGGLSGGGGQATGADVPGEPARAPAGAGELPGTLGDFRIVREVGRGGMGIVYEAEQVSLRRRVALKVLPFAATADAGQVQRFHNEAQAAACLHHSNIVPVYFVGCERGVHFYAMQFIDGQPLSTLIRQLRGPEKKTAAVAAEARTTAYQPAPEDAITAGPTPGPAADATPLTAEGRRGRDYFRRVAELGVQAAEALDHAHQLGIVHRDVKPANLLLDGAGRLWVTDFGLAHVRHGEAALTLTGQALGTPRYMSPEQALAKRVPIDHRTDVYSLGATLYELLTLRPAFAGEDRQELLRQIAFEDPARPRRLDRAIPAELETIVLKALEKRPQDRYATAQELADDLRRWLLDQPIRARRPSWAQVARKWARRHRGLVGGAAAALLVGLAVLAGSIGWVVRDQEARRAASEQVVRAALADSHSWQGQRRLPEALSAARRADGLLAGSDVDEALRQRVRARLADLELLDRLENVRLETMTAERDAGADKEERWDYEGADALYGQAFRGAGLDVEALPAEEAAERIGNSTVAAELAAVLDHWTFVRRWVRGRDDASWRHLLRVARLADPDPWRTRMRQAHAGADRGAVLKLAGSPGALRHPPATLVVLGSALVEIREARGPVERFLREAQRRHPDDFWLNDNLYQYLSTVLRPPQGEEAVRFAAVAAALRPGSPGAHLNLGHALAGKGRLEEAIAEYREAIGLKRDFAKAHTGLGNALYRKGLLAEAIAEHREAIRLKPDYALAHSNLGAALCDGKKDYDGAIAAFRQALRLKKDFPEAHFNLGNALRDKGLLGEAIAAYREALRLKPGFHKDKAHQAHHNLGNALYGKGRLDEAIAEYRQALRLKKDDPWAHCGLGNALKAQGRLDEAVAEYREALRLKKDYPEAHTSLGIALRDKGRLDEAIAEYREAIRLKKDLPEAHNNLGVALKDKGVRDEAIAEYREAIRLKKDDPVAHYNLGNALKDKGLLGEAIREYREALRLKRDLPEPRCGLGNALYAKGRLDEAIASFRGALRLKKDYAEAHYNLGIALRDKGRLDEAIACYREALRLRKDYAEAHNNLGGALRDKGRLEEAIAEFRLALNKQFPEAYMAHYNLGNALKDKGRLDEAITAYREAIKLKKDYAEAHYGIGNALKDQGRLDAAIAELREAIHLKKDYAEAHLNLGNALYGKRRLDEAIAEYRKAVDSKKDYPDAHLNLGAALYGKGRLEEAIAEFRQALRLKKDYAEAHNNLGVALKAKGLLDEAIAAYRQAIRIKEDDAEAHNNLGGALRDKGRLEEAIAEFRQALRLRKDYAEAHCGLGLALADKGRVDEAITEYQQALRLRKDLPEAHQNLGNALMDKGRLEEAVAEFREAIRLKKDYPEAHLSLGAALADKGRTDEAIAEYREALRLKKDYAEAHWNLGVALSENGLLEEAIGEYRKGIRLKKDDPQAYNNLGLLLRRKGRLGEAIAAFRQALRLKKDFPLAHHNLGNALRDKGLLDEAIAEYRQAIRLKKDDPAAHNDLGALLCDRKKDYDGAIAEFREAIRLKKDFPEAHFNLGNCLLRKGQFREALAARRRGHELGSKRPGWPYPSLELVRQAEALVKLDEKLVAVLRGEQAPAGVVERVGLAQVSALKSLNAAAARFYAEAFADKPELADDLRLGFRYNAARAAALAGCGKGKGAPAGEEERARLRRQALGWLRADLAAWHKVLEGNRPKAAQAVAAQMQHWLIDADFAGVRGPESLKRLPEGERGGWERLWREVDELRRKSEAPAARR